MMKNFYRVTRNSWVIAESESLDDVKEVAQKEASIPLEWKDLSDEEDFYVFAFGAPNRTTERDEYEVTIFRKRV